MGWHEVPGAASLGDDEAMGVVLQERPVALVRSGGTLHALHNVCTHQFAYLSEGELEGDQIKCPLHGAKFDVKTGQAKSLPAVKAVPKHEVKIEDGHVYVALNPKRVKIGGRGRRRR